MRKRKSGSGKVVLQCIRPPYHVTDDVNDDFGNSDAVEIQHTYPLKILIPSHIGSETCKWIYPITFGGGLVGGDETKLDIHVKENCCGLLTSQESTKIYHCEGEQTTSQSFIYRVENNGLLCVLPDYLVCYADSHYTQTQKIEISPGGNLVFVDWLTAGRVARGEEWQFKRYLNKTEVRIDDALVFRDQLCLEDQPNISIHQSMKKYQVVGMCLLIGHKLKNMCKDIKHQLAKPKSYGESYDTDTVCSVSEVNTKSGVPFLYIKFLAVTTSQAYGLLERIVQPIFPILGGDPYEHKY